MKSVLLLSARCLHFFVWNAYFLCIGSNSGDLKWPSACMPPACRSANYNFKKQKKKNSFLTLLLSICVGLRSLFSYNNTTLHTITTHAISFLILYWIFLNSQAIICTRVFFLLLLFVVCWFCENLSKWTSLTWFIFMFCTYFSHTHIQSHRVTYNVWPLRVFVVVVTIYNLKFFHY